MLKTFADLRQHISLGRKLVSIDNVVFLLNYRLTFLMLLTSTILVSSRQYIGDHIRCISQTIPGHVIDTFCFFTSTFTIPRYDNSTQVPHPGVGPMGRAEMEGEELRHHAYYQWVPFVLFGQAIMFYLPHLLWRTLEGGTIRLLVSGLEHGYLALAEKKILSVPSKASYREQVGVVRWAFLSRLDLNRWWGFELMLCEVLNALNVLVQLVFTDAFLGGRFLSLGPAVISRRPEDTDPLDLVFPKVTKCTFQKHGPTGTIQVHDTLCVMALNVINEKIYTFLWFWFIFMAIANTLGLVWRLLTILLFSRSAFMNRWLFDVDRRIDPNDFELVVSRCAYSHWLFLYYLCKNMHITARNQLFADLAAEMRLQRSNGYHLADTLPAGGTPRASGRQLDMMGSEEGPRSRSAGVPVNIDEPDHLSSSPLLLDTPPDHQDRPHRE